MFDFESSDDESDPDFLANRSFVLKEAHYDDSESDSDTELPEASSPASTSDSDSDMDLDDDFEEEEPVAENGVADEEKDDIQDNEVEEESVQDISNSLKALEVSPRKEKDSETEPFCPQLTNLTRTISFRG